MSEWKQAGSSRKRPYVVCGDPACKGNPRGAKSWIFIDQIADKPTCKYCETPWPSTVDVGKNGKGPKRRDKSVDAAQTRKERGLEKQVDDLKKQLQEAKNAAGQLEVADREEEKPKKPEALEKPISAAGRRLRAAQQDRAAAAVLLADAQAAAADAKIKFDAAVEEEFDAEEAVSEEVARLAAAHVRPPSGA